MTPVSQVIQSFPVIAHGKMKEFEITEELITVRSMKGNTPRSDLLTEVSAWLTLELKWVKMTSVATDDQI